jgi:hypothetical protein
MAKKIDEPPKISKIYGKLIRNIYSKIRKGTY